MSVEYKPGDYVQVEMNSDGSIHNAMIVWDRGRAGQPILALESYYQNPDGSASWRYEKNGYTTPEQSLWDRAKHLNIGLDLKVFWAVHTAQSRIIGLMKSTPIISSGVRCSGCQEWNDYAAANQSDGSFKCYGCRQR